MSELRIKTCLKDRNNIINKETGRWDAAWTSINISLKYTIPQQPIDVLNFMQRYQKDQIRTK